MLYKIIGWLVNNKRNSSIYINNKLTTISYSGMQSQEIEDKCKYTVIPIQNPQHREKLEKFIKTRGPIKLKGSLCRFYLRGICIMKPQYCKFAHSVKELDLDCTNDLYYLSDKQRKKRQFTQKKQFNQTALFILKNVKYVVLYDFQFSQRYKKSKLHVHDLDTISQDRGIRIRIREIMHRENWDGFLDFIQKKFPNTNYPISFISFWYANFGFDKPQTRCKFGDFLKYAMLVRKYIQVDIVFPPNSTPAIFLINSQSKKTILEQNAQELYKLCMESKEQEGKQKMEEFLEKALPEQLSKKYICRYFMAGNCQSPPQQCLYAHSIVELRKRYELGQVFPPQYRQPVMPIQVRLNFISLYQSTRKFKQYEQYSLEDINLNSTIRNELRQKIHLELFSDFLNFLEETLHTNKNKKEQFFSIQLKELQKYYSGAGFNHTNQNKFQHLEGGLWSLGYYMQDLVVIDPTSLEKKKIAYVYKIPPLEYLNSKYSKIIKQCVSNELSTVSQEGILLESALKRSVYSYLKQQQQIMPLHVYLRYRNVTFQDMVSQFCTSEQCQKILFESSEQNLKKLIQNVKKYIKKNKKYIMKIDEIETYIRQEKKDEISFNHHFFNVRTTIQTCIMDIGRKIYFWPFDNNAFVIDPQLINSYKTAVIQPRKKEMLKDQSLEKFKTKCTALQFDKFGDERIIVVDNFEKLVYSKKYLSTCAAMGADLQGKLRVDGYVDLIQISGVKRNHLGEIEHKHIFIYDIWLMRKQADQQIGQQVKHQKISQQILQITQQQNETAHQKSREKAKLLQQSIKFLREIFESTKSVKILHDCRHDSIALKHLLGINLQNVFDTSGFDVYLSQKILYEKQKEDISANLLRKIYDVKISGLNTVLDSYGAPKGVNIFKQSMKKRFGDPDSRPYFEQRPIDQQFLQYSARDVEDLIEIYETMIKSDTQHIASFIGELYSKC